MLFGKEHKVLYLREGPLENLCGGGGGGGGEVKGKINWEKKTRSEVNFTVQKNL